MTNTPRQRRAFFCLLVLLLIGFSCLLVASAESQLQFNKENFDIVLGKKYRLSDITYNEKKIKASALDWSSSDSSILAVGKTTGIFLGKQEGEATLTAKTCDGQTESEISIKIKNAETSQAATTSAKKIADSEIADLLTFVNDERKAEGLAALKSDVQLTQAAQARAKELAQSFSHIRPNSASFSTAIPSDYEYKAVGENIASGTAVASYNASNVFGRWMNSPLHKENMMNEQYNRIGMAYVDENGMRYWVQIFAKQ